jgi:hypothetical protein
MRAHPHSCPELSDEHTPLHAYASHEHAQVATICAIWRFWRSHSRGPAPSRIHGRTCTAVNAVHTAYDEYCVLTIVPATVL